MQDDCAVAVGHRLCRDAMLASPKGVAVGKAAGLVLRKVGRFPGAVTLLDYAA